MKQKKIRWDTSVTMPVSVQVLCDRNAAVARVTASRYLPRTGEYVTDEATGSSKREQGDTRDDSIAVSLAVGRALVNLGRALQHAGRVQVQAASAAHDQVDKTIMGRILRGMDTQQRALLPVSEIRERFGPEAADRAARRRAEPRGRHRRDQP